MPDIKKTQTNDNENSDLLNDSELNLDDLSIDLGDDDIDLSDITGDNITEEANLNDGIEDLEPDNIDETKTFKNNSEDELGDMDLSLDFNEKNTTDDSLNTDDLNLDDLKLEEISIEDNDLEGFEKTIIDSKKDDLPDMDGDLNLDDKINMDDDIKFDDLDEDVTGEDLSNDNKDNKLDDDLDLNLKSDLGLKDQLSLSEDEELNLDNDEFNLNISDDDFGSSEEEYGVDLKQDPQTIDSAALEESLNTDNILNDENYIKQLEEDSEIEKINIPDKIPIEINDEQEDFLHEDLVENEETLKDENNVKIEEEKSDDLSIETFDDFDNDKENNDFDDLKLEDDLKIDFDDKSPTDKSDDINELDLGDITDEDLKLDDNTDLNLNESDLDLENVGDDELKLDIDKSDNVDTADKKTDTSGVDLEDELSFDLDLDSGEFKDINLKESKDDTIDLNLDEDIPLEFEESTNEELQDLSINDAELDLLDEEPAEIKTTEPEELSIDSDISSENLIIDTSDLNLDIDQNDFINIDNAEKVGDELDLEDLEKTPSTLEAEIVGDKMSKDKKSNESDDESIKLEEADLSDIEDKIFPDDDQMPELDEDIASVKISGNEDLSNSISPLSDADSVLDDSFDINLDESGEDSKIDIDMSEIDLDNIPSEEIPKEEEEETIGLSSDELDNIIKDTDIKSDLSDNKENFEDMTETIDLSSFDADLQEVQSDELKLEEVKEEDVYSGLKNELLQKKKESDESVSADGESLKNNVKEVLKYLDQLLDALPEDKIKEFAESKTFDLYKNLFDQLDIEH